MLAERLEYLETHNRDVGIFTRCLDDGVLGVLRVRNRVARCVVPAIRSGQCRVSERASAESLGRSNPLSNDCGLTSQQSCLRHAKIETVSGSILSRVLADLTTESGEIYIPTVNLADCAAHQQRGLLTVSNNHPVTGRG